MRCVLCYSTVSVPMRCVLCYSTVERTDVVCTMLATLATVATVEVIRKLKRLRQKKITSNVNFSM